MKQGRKFQRLFISKLYTASDLFKEHGWMRFVGDIIPWLFHRRYIFYSQPIDDPVLLYSCQIPFRLEQVKEKDFPHLIKLRPGFYDLSLIRKRIKEGHICFLGWSGQKPIHIRWIFVRSLYLPYLHRTLILYPGEVYRDEAFTLPDYRRKGVYSYAGYLMRYALKELGYNRLFCMFASWNLSPGTGMRIQFARIKFKIIFVLVIVPEIDIAIREHAFGYDEIMRFISCYWKWRK